MRYGRRHGYIITILALQQIDFGNDSIVRYFSIRISIAWFEARIKASKHYCFMGKAGRGINKSVDLVRTTNIYSTSFLQNQKQKKKNPRKADIFADESLFLIRFYLRAHLCLHKTPIISDQNGGTAPIRHLTVSSITTCLSCFKWR